MSQAFRSQEPMIFLGILWSVLGIPVTFLGTSSSADVVGIVVVVVVVVALILGKVGSHTLKGPIPVPTWGSYIRTMARRSLRRIKS